MDTKTQSKYDENPELNYLTTQPAKHYPNATAPEQSAPARGRYCRNLPQFLSVGAGACIIFTGGMCMPWRLREIDGWDRYLSDCWFVMAIVGAILSAALTNLLMKKKLLFLSAVLVMIGGILIILFNDDSAATIVAQHLNGFAVGLTLVTTFVMAGEEAAKEVRGLISSIAAIFINLGFLTTKILELEWTRDSDIQLRGVFVLIFGSLSIALILTQVIESPVYFLKRNQELQALNCLKSLQRPAMMDAGKYVQLDEFKHYIAESSGSGKDALPALLKLSLLHGVIVLCNNFMRFIIIWYILTVKSEAKVSILFWFFIAFGCHFAGILMGSLSQDSIGRRLILIAGTLFYSGVAIGLSIILDDDIDRWQTYAVIVLSMIYQFSIGLCITSSSSYLSEAFPVTVKPYCIAWVLSIEMAVSIICANIWIDLSTMVSYFLLLGSISFVFVIFIVLYFPETKNTSLREALQKFNPSKVTFVDISYS